MICKDFSRYQRKMCFLSKGPIQIHLPIDRSHKYSKVFMSEALKRNCRLTGPKASRAESTDDEWVCQRQAAHTVKTDICKYKTQLCKNYSQKGFCPYKGKCQFAHGQDELAKGIIPPKRAYRTRKCRSFWEHGTCRYGFRCQFSHTMEPNRNGDCLLKVATGLFSKQCAKGAARLTRILQNAEL